MYTSIGHPTKCTVVQPSTHCQSVLTHSCMLTRSNRNVRNQSAPTSNIQHLSRLSSRNHLRRCGRCPLAVAPTSGLTSDHVHASGVTSTCAPPAQPPQAAASLRPALAPGHPQRTAGRKGWPRGDWWTRSRCPQHQGTPKERERAEARPSGRTSKLGSIRPDADAQRTGTVQSICNSEDVCLTGSN